MIYITCNTKGGVGKSLTSINLACLLHAKGNNFKVVELDSSNNSIVFKNSDFLTQDKAISLNLDQKDNAVSDMLFDVMSDANLDYILDLGGSTDTLNILEMIKPIQLPKTYLIPTLKIKKYMQNALNTFNFIGDPQNVVFVLNQYTNFKKLESEFKYFYGDKEMGIKPVSPIFAKSRTISLPFSDLFQVAEDDEQTILDLSNISKDISESEARTSCFNLANGDKDKFGVLIQQYRNSIDAAKLFQEIQESTKSLFQE